MAVGDVLSEDSGTLTSIGQVITGDGDDRLLGSDNESGFETFAPGYGVDFISGRGGWDVLSCYQGFLPASVAAGVTIDVTLGQAIDQNGDADTFILFGGIELEVLNFNPREDVLGLERTVSKDNDGFREIRDNAERKGGDVVIDLKGGGELRIDDFKVSGLTSDMFLL
ncbi:MAG: hypothetical protein AAFX39_00270 [Pseudomonadota bacterium]